MKQWIVLPAALLAPAASFGQVARNGYLDAVLEKKLDAVPRGNPCNRTEGGLRTGKGVPEDSCTMGVPSGVNIVARRFVVPV